MHTTAAKAQVQTTKDVSAEEPKAWGPKPLSALQRSNNNELSKKAWKKKKKNNVKETKNVKKALLRLLKSTQLIPVSFIKWKNMKVL